MRPRRARKPLPEAEGEKQFFVYGGYAIKNLRELRDALARKSINDEQFLHHVNAVRNDFANWTRDVLGDTKCAASLFRAKSRKGVLGAIERSLKQYQ